MYYYYATLPLSLPPPTTLNTHNNEDAMEFAPSNCLGDLFKGNVDDLKYVSLNARLISRINLLV